MLCAVHPRQQTVNAVTTADLLIGSDLGRQDLIDSVVKPIEPYVQPEVRMTEARKVRLHFEAASC
jgi:hypothetical protein